MSAIGSTGFSQDLSRNFGVFPSTYGDAANHSRYWPCDLLHAFTLLMAARGYCVNESMMLGDPAYAMEKLSLAHTCNDESLRELAVRMFGYFDVSEWASRTTMSAQQALQ